MRTTHTRNYYSLLHALKPFTRSMLRLITIWHLLLIVTLVCSGTWLAGPGVKLFRPAKAASTFYVRTDGSDTMCNGNTNASPDDNPPPNCAFQTIGKAVTTAASGDTIIVAVGTYTENLILNKSVMLLGANAGVFACGSVEDETIIVPLNPAVRTLELQTGSAGAIINGFNFSGGTRQIESTSGPLNNLQIINNRFTGFTFNAVFLSDPGTDITVSRNAIDGASKTGSGGLFQLDTDIFDGFYFTVNCVFNGAMAGAGTGFLVDGNRNIRPSANRSPLFDNNSIFSNTTGINSGSRSFLSVTFSNNTINDNVFDGYQGGPKDSTLINNTFNANGRSGIALTSFGNMAADSGAQNTKIKQNLISGNGFTNNGEGILFSNTQFAGTISTNHANYNRIVGNRVGATYNGTETIDVENNWWGCNYGPGVGGAGCGVAPNGLNGTGAANLDANPWLTLTLTAMPTSVPVGGDSMLTAKLTINSDGVDTALLPMPCFVPDRTQVTFASAGRGTVVPITDGTENGVAKATYTGETPGNDTVSATVDGQTVSTVIMIPCMPITGTVSGGTGEGAICAGQPATVTVTVSNGMAPYTMILTNGGGTQTGDGPIFNFTVSPTMATTYMVAAGSQDVNGCPISNSGSATVMVKSTPTCMISGANSVTTGTTNTYNGSSTLLGSSFNWIISGNGTFSGPTTNPTVNVIAGAPGSYTLTLTVMKDGCSSTCTFMVTINCQTITVTNPTINTGTAGAAFSQTFTQAGGIGTTTFSTASTLPAGLTLSQ
ncbi:MAG: right-handed parallel beta-helix repeat-containing protein, partial [Blastocatellia bacterium]